MNKEKKIELLEELVTILYRMKDDSGLGYPPSKFVKDINRIEEIESELAELDKEQGKEQTAEELDLIQYVINLLYAAYDKGNEPLNNSLEYDKWVEDRTNELKEYASQKQPVLPTEEEIKIKFPIKGRMTIYDVRTNLWHRKNEFKIQGVHWVIDFINKHK